jgi:cytochrome P450
MSVDCPVVDQDLTDPAFNRDPYPVLESWRELGPVLYNLRHKRYMTFAYGDCSRVLGKLDVFDSGPSADVFRRLFGGLTMEAIDGQRHRDMRAVWATDFRRDTLENDQSDLIARVVAGRVDPFVKRLHDGETVDAVRNMTRGIPTLVIAQMLGIEPAMYEQFSEWSDRIGSSEGSIPDPTPEQAANSQAAWHATQSLNEYIASVVVDRRANSPGDDLVSRMVFDDYAAQMSEEEIIASNTQLVFAGNETTAKLMASTLVALAQHPDQRRALVADRSLIPQAIEEAHRWSTVVQTIPRWANSDESIVGEVRIPRGDEVMPILGAANRDPQRWKKPAEFDIHRPGRQNLGFGFGIHICIGLHLARIEIAVWLDQLLTALPDFELAGPVEYGRNFSLRGPSEVPLVAA